MAPLSSVNQSVSQSVRIPALVRRNFYHIPTRTTPVQRSVQNTPFSHSLRHIAVCSKHSLILIRLIIMFFFALRLMLLRLEFIVFSLLIKFNVFFLHLMIFFICLNDLMVVLLLSVCNFTRYCTVVNFNYLSLECVFLLSISIFFISLVYFS